MRKNITFDNLRFFHNQTNNLIIIVCFPDGKNTKKTIKLQNYKRYFFAPAPKPRPAAAKKCRTNYKKATKQTSIFAKKQRKKPQKHASNAKKNNFNHLIISRLLFFFEKYSILFEQGTEILYIFAEEKSTKIFEIMEATNFKQQLRKTCMEYIVLHAIKHKPSYAPDIIAELKRANLIVVEGTLYPLLTRLKNNGLLTYTWQESTQGPPRKYYSLNDDGQAHLAAMDKEYDNIKTIIDLIDPSK